MSDYNFMQKGLIGEHIKAVVFDFDDTLVGTIEAKWAAHKHVVKTHYGRTLTDEEIRPHWGKPLRTLVGLLYGDEDLDRALAREQAVTRDFPKHVLGDVVDILVALRKSGKYIGLVTATTQASLDVDLEVAPIPPELFDYTQTQDDTEFHKPDPRVFDPVLEWLGSLSIQPHEAIYVGDGLHDCEAALGAGLEFIGVATGLVTQQEFLDHGIPAVSKLNDLVDL